MNKFYLKYIYRKITIKLIILEININISYIILFLSATSVCYQNGCPPISRKFQLT